MLSALVLAALLVSYLSIFFFGQYVGTYGSIVLVIANLLLGLGAMVAGYGASDLFSASHLWEWIAPGYEGFIGFSIRFDEYTMGMYMVVITVSSLVHVFSSVYMYTDPFLSRFLSYLTLFTLFMLILVSADNFVVLFLGWEGVGVCSYLLISFWYTRFQAAKAATKAFIINKVGDVFLLLGIAILFSVFSSVDFSTLFSSLPYSAHATYSALVSCLFIGVVGKSAQIGLHTWLPDAMEGPTPVSALIHAATMVTAGVFLMIRSAPIFEIAPSFLFAAAGWGAFTAFFSGVIGLAQNDIKKIIAYSTCSQLGYMVLACGLSQYSLAFFHLFNHAFFKACLFLSAGSVIHVLLGEQDTRKMGGLAVKAPFIHTAILVSSLSLMGVTFLSGFYSKDAIIEAASAYLIFGSGMLYWLAITAALLTAAYSLKLAVLAFAGAGFSGFKLVASTGPGMTGIEAIVLSALVVGGLLSGFVFRDAFTGFGSSVMELFGEASFALSFAELELLDAAVKALPLVGSVGVAALYSIVTSPSGFVTRRMAGSLEALRFYYNEVSNRYLSLPTLSLARRSFESWEKGALEAYGPLSISVVSAAITNKQ